jgi:CBS domain-containing protein
VASLDNAGPRIPVAEALGLTVGEVMIATPKTLPATVLVRDVRAVFGQPSHRTVLLTDNGIFRGSIERERFPADADDNEPAARYAEIQPVTATPDMPIPEAVALLERQAEPRLVVLDDDGRQLRGLLCLNRTENGFCVR